MVLRSTVVVERREQSRVVRLAAADRAPAQPTLRYLTLLYFRLITLGVSLRGRLRLPLDVPVQQQHGLSPRGLRLAVDASYLLWNGERASIGQLARPGWQGQNSSC